MKCIQRLIVVALVLAGATLGWGAPEDQYVRVYDLIQQADALGGEGKLAESLSRYEEAMRGLQELQTRFPAWNVSVVQYRIKYLAQKIAATKPLVPAVPPNASATGAPAAAVAPGLPLDAQNRIADLEIQVRQLQNERQLLEAKLREALSVQPPALDPGELARREEQIRSLEKERDLLKVTLSQEKERSAGMVEPDQFRQAQKDLEAVKEKLIRQAADTAKLISEKEGLEQKLLEEKEKSGRAANAADLEQARQALEAANARLAQQAEAGNALTQEKDLLLKKLQEAQAQGLAEQTATAQKNQAALAEAEQKLARLNERIETLKQDKTDLQKLLDDERARAPKPGELAELETIKRALTEANEKLARQTELADTTLKQKDELEKQLRDEREKLAANADLAKMREIEQQLAQANRKLSEQAQEIEILNKEKDMLRESLRTRHSSEGLVRSLETENASLKKQLVELRQQNEALMPQVEKSGLELEQARKELGMLKTSFEALQMEKDLLQKRLEVLANSPNPEPDQRLIEAEKRLADVRRLLQASEVQVAALARERDILQNARTDLEQKLAEAQAETARLRNLDIGRLQKLERDLQQAQAETRDRDLKIDLLSKERQEAEVRLAGLLSEIEAGKHGKDARKIRELEKERERLQKKLNETAQSLYALRDRTAGLRVDELNNQVAGLRARVEAYELKRVPLTPEELALLKGPAVDFAAAKEPPKPVPEMPNDARTLVAQADTDARAGRFQTAEQKYRSVLSGDDANVYTLYKLAGVQLDQDRYDEAEKTVLKGLEIEPNNAGLLYQLGIVRYNQGKLDESVAALSQSVKNAPTQAQVYNYLGFVLGKKGMLNEAETAFRKALQIEPGMLMAHMSLSWVYATQKPAFLELSRWHYHKAIDGGHARDPELEKKLNVSP